MKICRGIPNFTKIGQNVGNFGGRIKSACYCIVQSAVVCVIVLFRALWCALLYCSERYDVCYCIVQSDVMCVIVLLRAM